MEGSNGRGYPRALLTCSFCSIPLSLEGSFHYCDPEEKYCQEAGGAININALLESLQLGPFELQHWTESHREYEMLKL